MSASATLRAEEVSPQAREKSESPVRSPRPESRGWVFGRGQDLVWLQGSALAGVLLVILFRCLPQGAFTPAQPTVLLLLLWGVLFDGTHVMGTYARTWLAPDAATQQLPKKRWWLLIALGPALAIADQLLPQGPSLLGTAGPLFQAYLLAAYLWAYWHLVRQHYGFLCLYQRRSTESAPGLFKSEAALLWVGTLYPFLRFSLGPDFIGSGLPVLVPATWLPVVRPALDVAAGVAGAGLIAHMALETREGLGPRHLFLAAVIGLHLLVFASLGDLLQITAALTVFHNLQYHRIVWQHERGKGRRPLGGMVRYLGLGVLFGAAWYLPRIMGVAVAPVGLPRNLLLGLGWGIAHHHYLVDGQIWKVRHTPGLARTLEGGSP